MQHHHSDKVNDGCGAESSTAAGNYQFSRWRANGTLSENGEQLNSAGQNVDGNCHKPPFLPRLHWLVK